MIASRHRLILLSVAFATSLAAADGVAQPARPQTAGPGLGLGGDGLLAPLLGVGGRSGQVRPGNTSVGAVVQSVTAPLAPVTAPVATAVTSPVAAVVGTVGAVVTATRPVTAPLATTVGSALGATQTLTTTVVQPVLGAVPQTVQPTTAAALQTFGAVTAPLAPTLNTVLAPVANLTQQTLGGVVGLTQTTVSAVGATVQGLPAILHPAPAPALTGPSGDLAGAAPTQILAISGAQVSGIAVSPGLLFGGGLGTAQVVATQIPAKSQEAPAFDSAPNEMRRELGLRLVRLYPEALEADAGGQPIVRGEVLRIGSKADVAAAARRLGFEVRRVEGMEALGLEVTVFTAPTGVGARAAARRLAELDPSAQYVVNPIYLPTGQAAAARGGASAGPARQGGAPTRLGIGLVDGGVAADHPSLAGTEVVQQGFARGGARPTNHGTAVASLIAGREGAFRSAAPGARLYAADVYGSGPTGGSATAVVQALAWLAAQPVKVINISLAGPPNPVLEAAVRALADRGRVLVAAVGNDGPASPPSYPSAYPGVVAVTAVNGRRLVLPEAGRSGHVDFAAPGADMVAAAAAGGFTTVRGTSFAAPLVAGRLAETLSRGASSQQAMSTLAREAVDLGAPGRDPVYGAGLIAFDLRTPPDAVSASVLARR